ncbi:hypothetical protein [Prosthecobacter sp.]|jgi:hypothetical protein|uniref:hypothetical protein n=1 Tax=Prosthecobacter sp. TaxID=1965333 RepID=UPI003783B472
MLILRQLGIVALLGLSSCTYFMGKYAAWKLASPKDSKNNRMGEAKVVGVIELVNPEQNYVLINCEQRLNIPAGTEIVAQSTDGTKTKLKVSPERKGNYITADITEGAPQIRDLVLYQVKQGELAVAPGTAPAAPVSGPPVQLTPIMQADVIPPLDAPFQPTAPVSPSATPTPPVLQPPPASTPSAEPVADPGKLPPVIR